MDDLSQLFEARRRRGGACPRFDLVERALLVATAHGLGHRRTRHARPSAGLRDRLDRPAVLASADTARESVVDFKGRFAVGAGELNHVLLPRTNLPRNAEVDNLSYTLSDGVSRRQS